eukprot:2633440-Rhodomonas_salina.1
MSQMGFKFQKKQSSNQADSSSNSRAYAASEDSRRAPQLPVMKPSLSAHKQPRRLDSKDPDEVAPPEGLPSSEQTEPAQNEAPKVDNALDWGDVAKELSWDGSEQPKRTTHFPQQSSQDKIRNSPHSEAEEE